jgi:DNA-binding SARP family transcriptional activator
MATLQIQLLGSFHIRYDGEPVAGLHAARLQSLLPYLLLHAQQPHARRQLAFLFWPDSSEAQAHSNLRKTLSTLRSTIPDAAAFLAIDAQTVQWRSAAPYHLDVAQFEQQVAAAEQPAQSQEHTQSIDHLAAAVELYAGDLLPTCYDDWIVPERERLRERYLDALLRLSDLLEQARDVPAAIRQVTRLLRADPLHEESYRRLMRLHLLNRDRAAALRAYHSAAERLQRELGVEPSPATQEIYAQVLHLETTPAPRPARPRDALVGRHPEWQRLMALWQQVAHGQARLVLVGGEPGIGKTRLVEELAQWVAQQGYTAAAARAYAAEGGLAYDPIAAWLRGEPLRRALEQLDETWLGEVARLLPELSETHPALAAPQPMSESWQRRHFFEALARRAGRAPAAPAGPGRPAVV